MISLDFGLKRIMKKTLLIAFVTTAIMLSYNNCLRTEVAIMNVQEFFIHTHTVQAAQVASDRAMRLVEAKTYEYNDLKEFTKSLHERFQRLTFQAEDAMMKAALYEQMIHSQNVHIVQLEDLLRDNSIPVPVQPNLLEPQTCPTPQHPSAGNSFNLQRPTSPMPNALPPLPGGSSPRSLTEPDAFGTEGRHEA